MKKQKRLDMKRIARGLGAVRRGKVYPTGGFFGAAGLVAEVQVRFKTPEGGGRPTDPHWTTQRQVRMARRTLDRLEALSAKVRERGVNVEPMQLAALVLEKMVERIGDAEVEELASSHGSER